MTAPVIIVFPVFPGVTQLDFTGPYQVLVRTPGTELIVASVGGAPVDSAGLTFSNLARLEEVRERYASTLTLQRAVAEQIAADHRLNSPQ